MKLYEIKINIHNPSENRSVKYAVSYTDLNTAKRMLLELVMNDENSLKEGAICEISKDLLSAYSECGKNRNFYFITEKNFKVCTDKSSKVTNEELQKIIKGKTEIC